MNKRIFSFFFVFACLCGGVMWASARAAQTVRLDGHAGGKRFDGIGIVNGGGATSVLLKDYPEPQRSQILDMVYKPKFGASVSALLVEIPGDGNSTQGSMPSHMHTRDDLDYTRGYIWWILSEAKKRNPRLTLDGTAWSAPGWMANESGKTEFWSQDTADYYVKWLQGLRDVYGLDLDAIGCRNEKGYDIGFAKTLRATLNANGFASVKLHAFDHWPSNSKFSFVKQLLDDKEARDAIDIIGAHVMYAKDDGRTPPEVLAMAEKLGKPIWNTEDHVYKKGFDCAISIVECFNENYIHSGATKIVNWYDIAGVYPMEPYSEDPAMVLAHSPWSGHYKVRENVWGYAHYGQFTEAGWQYLNGGCGVLDGGGTFVTMKSPGSAKENDYSIIIETKDAKVAQQIRFEVGGGLPLGKKLCVWRSNAQEQFVEQQSIQPSNGIFTITLEPDSIYSLSTTVGQQKGGYENIPAEKAFPFPYFENFESYADPKQYGHLPRYFADIAGAFELANYSDKQGARKCLRQVAPVPTLSWAPDWMPYTIIGDENWTDYEVSAEVNLKDGDIAGVMGRVNHVGTGWGFIPKGYYLQLGDDGECRLVVIRGKKDKKKLTGDAEQQALIKKQNDDSEGGEKILATAKIPNMRAGDWHTLKLRFEGATITGFIDEKPVVTATDTLYARGMAGLIAVTREGDERKKLSTPYFDNVQIKAPGAVVPHPARASENQMPIYAGKVGRASSSPRGELEAPPTVKYEEIRVEAPFAMPAIRVPVFPQRDFVITDFGAKVGGDNDNTAAIRKAIAACHDAGGGRVVIPAGTWTTGAIHLRSNVNLHLAKGAVLSFSDNPADYLPAVQSSWEGWECFNYSPLIYAFQCENIALTGEGKIEPRMGTWKKWAARPPAHMDALKRLYTMGSTGVPVEKRQMAEGENNLRPHLIQFNRCKNALIEDVRIRNSPFWVVHLLLCDSVVVRGIDVSAHGHNNDGIDPENTRNLLVENCTFDQGDDAIVIKSGSNQDGWRLGVPSENIVIRNCVVKNGHQIVAIGSELSGGVRNVYAHDIRFEPGSHDGHAVTPFNVLYIKTNRRRGGVIENITVEHIDASAAKFRMGVFGIETDILYQWRKLVPTYEERITTIRDITVRNIKAGQTATPFLIEGDKDQPVKNITIENVSIGTVRGQKNRYQHAENVTEKNITIGTFIDEPYKESTNK